MLSCDFNVIECPVPPTDTAVRKYLKEALGIEPAVHAWPGAGRLPYFLQDAFDVRELNLYGRSLVLAIDRKRTGKTSLSGVRVQLAKLRELAGCPAVYATGELASYERKRLIEQKVPFIVPGNQLYLPDLAIDLREHFREARGPRAAALGPAAQAMLIKILLRRPWNPDWQPAEVITQLGYTPMTGTRAVRELTLARIAVLHTEGRTRWLRMERGAAETWAYAKPMLRSPVKRHFWADPMPTSGRLAGLSALARYSMLGAPAIPTFAVDPGEWKKLSQEKMERHSEPQTGLCEWQLWHYATSLDPDRGTVDPLSLSLSFQGSLDERVQQALVALEEEFPW